MTDGHCFISYSHADGLDFVTKLADELEGGHPFIKVWFEKREMVAGRDDWDDQLAKAIRDSKCLLFVMSKDSTGGHSNCKDEWTWALKYKKPVICLWIDSKAEDQFRLNSRQKIDFTSNFDQGLAKLRKTIAFLDSPEGELEELRHRLADANRDLHRVPDEERPRVQADIDELKRQIEIQQNIVDNPKAAAEQTQKNIEAGLERERRPEKETKAKETSTKFINPPPGIAPIYFQDRTVETEQVFKFLQDDSQRLMTIVGRGGVGKTAMVCRLLKGLEGGELPDGLGSMRVEGIVYLSESGSHRVNFANLFYDLCKLLPKETAQELDAVYKNPQGSTESKMRALLEKFTGAPIILLLDNFEPLVDIETFEIKDAELNEALLAFLNGTHTAVNIVITTRVAPKKLNLAQPGRQRPLDLDDGLESPYAENILRDMDSDGRMGLKSAPNELLNRARERTRGYPRALEALFAILASDRYTSLEELLEKPTPENVVQELVGEAFNRLDTNAQKVMQALAVYNRPVTPAAVDYLLAPHLPAMDSAPILQRLVSMHFARRESGRFYLHPVDRDFAFNLIPTDVMRNAENVKDASYVLRITDYESRFTQHDLTSRAADYFAQARKPRAKWKKLEDLSAQLAEFDLRCAAEDYDTAASVLLEIDFDFLLLWGHYHLMIDLYGKLQEKIKDKELARRSIGNMGQALISVGKVKEAISNFEIALDMAKEAGNLQAEGVWIGNLGNAYSDLGDARKAINFYESQLVIVRKIGDRRGEGTALGNLGNRNADLGDARKAIEFYESQLIIVREIGNRRGEGTALGNLGNTHADLGDARKAIELYESQLAIVREIGDRHGEAFNFDNTALAYIILENDNKASEFFQLAIQIADELSLYRIQNYSREGLAKTYLFKNELVNAHDTIETALQYSVSENNHNTSTVQGIIALRQRDEVTARGAFLRAIGQADEILSKTAEYYSALDAKGLAICGLLICDLRLGKGDPSMPTKTKDGKTISPDKDTVSAGWVAPTVDDAIETFRKARKIAPHAGIVKANLRLFDELMKCEGGEILKDVRKAVEGK